MAVPPAPAEMPAALGRYRVCARIAAGGFGVVYRGEDVELGRTVAIKVLHRHLLDSDATVNAFLLEARILARLEHPGIVPVYDIGATEDGLYFLVARFVEGLDLDRRLQRERLSRYESADILAQGAAALAHAHRHGLIHRDVKPSNLLLDSAGRVFLIDFGLALRREDFGTGPMFVGTVPYMSPEQARGEGHRVDARTDIYSLGVVLYQLLTGRRPFTASDRDELRERIATQEPAAPRELDDTIPVELERICLKAMAFRATDRYAGAQEFADDLHDWLKRMQEASSAPPPLASLGGGGPKAEPRLVPRGLRSFTARDADIFLELLPGPRNTDGLPENLAFWKRRLESTDPEQAFRVGVMYGPSGCGKTSLMAAGLQPRLAETAHAVLVEATAEGTEAALHSALRRQFPATVPEPTVAETFAALRRGRGLDAGHKVVVIIDQFEQWLHAPRDAGDMQLIHALRQCDGVRIQCLLMVRDDFWLPVSRLMREVEVPLVEGHNIGLVDLFDVLHTRRVLADCGHAYGRLPRRLAECSPEQQRFLDQAVAMIAENDRVVPVRLMLFVEMVKGQRWAPATLRANEVEGIGVQFLEATFSAAKAPAAHRLHEKAVRAVLAALLPEGGKDIKGRRRSYEELLAASGYAGRPDDFAELLRILDREHRLITPAVEGNGADATPCLHDSRSASAPDHSGSGRSYQLTHDYLVPSVRQWLTRDQRRNWRGRAELLLAERSADWNARPESRNLPNMIGWASIRLGTRGPWTEGQRRMVRAADRRHLGIAAVVLLLALAGLFVTQQLRGRFREAQDAVRAEELVARVRNPEHFQPEELAEAIEANPHLVVPRLHALLDDPRTSAQERLQIRLVLLPTDPGQQPPLSEALLTVPPAWVGRVSRALIPYKENLSGGLWKRTEDARESADVRLRCACALAAFDPTHERWARITRTVSADLLLQNPLFLGYLLEALQPVRARLLPPLVERFRLEEEADRRNIAAEVLAVYANDRPDLLAELVVDGDGRQFEILWPSLRNQKDADVHFSRILAQKVPDEGRRTDREESARRHAQAAIALLRLGKAEHAWPLLRYSPHPSVRSWLIELFASFAVDPTVLVEHFHREGDASARQALLLGLGSFSAGTLPPETKQSLQRELLDVYRSAEDPGLRGAAGWLLRRWHENNAIDAVDRELTRARKPPDPTARWYVNGQGQTMVVVRGPAEFRMGPAPGEAHRDNEVTRQVRIDHAYAIAAQEVTVEQFLRFEPGRKFAADENHAPRAPITRLTRLEAMRYCRWLSEQEGVPEDQMCYPAIDKIERGHRLPDDHGSRTGYRLATEAEWEYACRAGSLTAYGHGDAIRLLRDYAWYVGSSKATSHPVGELKPNHWGLFDMHGNVWEWCADGVPPRGPDGDSFVMRGGNALAFPIMQRSATRLLVGPTSRFAHQGAGVRLARSRP